MRLETRGWDSLGRALPEGWMGSRGLLRDSSASGASVGIRWACLQRLSASGWNPKKSEGKEGTGPSAPPPPLGHPGKRTRKGHGFRTRLAGRHYSSLYQCSEKTSLLMRNLYWKQKFPDSFLSL